MNKISLDFLYGFGVIVKANKIQTSVLLDKLVFVGESDYILLRHIRYLLVYGMNSDG